MCKDGSWPTEGMQIFPWTLVGIWGRSGENNKMCSTQVGSKIVTTQAHIDPPPPSSYMSLRLLPLGEAYGRAGRDNVNTSSGPMYFNKGGHILEAGNDWTRKVGGQTDGRSGRSGERHGRSTKRTWTVAHPGENLLPVSCWSLPRKR